MRHTTGGKFSARLEQLPLSVQKRARRCLEMLRETPPRRSLNLKKIGHRWSARIDLNYRMLGNENEDGEIVWNWIGPHHQYDKFL